MPQIARSLALSWWDAGRAAAVEPPTAANQLMPDMTRNPDHDPIASSQPLPGDERDTFEDELEAAARDEEGRIFEDEPMTYESEARTAHGHGPKPKLEIRRNSTPEAETVTIAFRHRPPATSQTGTLIPGEIEAALTYHDLEAALQDACEFVTAALAAVRASVRRDD